MKLYKYIIGWFSMVIFIIGIGVGLYFLYDDGYSILAVIFIGFYSISLFSSIIVFLQNRQMAGKLAWLLFFLLIPILAPVVFLLFGQRYRERMSIHDYRKKKTFKFEKKSSIKREGRIDSILAKQSYISHRGIYKTDAEIFSTGDEGYKRLFEDLENAKNFIHLQYYIIKPGEIFDHLKDILLRKAAEGVEVKFIVDDFGRWAVPWHEIKSLKKAGIQIERFGKVYFPFLGSYNGFRMHRKAAIIDGQIVHTGGINIADEYSNLNKNYGLWMDYQIRFKGEAVRSYTLLFLDDWHHVTGEILDPKKYLKHGKEGKSKFVMIEDSPEVIEPVMQDSIVNMIANARKEIILTTPYLVPTPELFSAIRTAAKSGVKIKILIPGKADKKAVIIATKYYANLLAGYGVEVYEAKNLLIHSKIGLFDNEYAYVGTANLDVRSLYSQWEVIQLLTGPIVKDISKVIDGYLELTRKLDKDELSISWLKEKFIRIYVKLFSPIM